MIPHISSEAHDEAGSIEWALQGVQRVLAVAMPGSSVGTASHQGSAPSTPTRAAAKSNMHQTPASPRSVASSSAGQVVAEASPARSVAAAAGGGDGGFIKPAYYNAPADGSVAESLAALKESLMGRGVQGIVAIGRKFRIIDDDGSKSISLPEWRKAMAEHRLEGVLSEQQIEVCPRGLLPAMLLYTRGFLRRLCFLTSTATPPAASASMSSLSAFAAK